MERAVNRRVEELESTVKRLGMIEAPNYSDGQRAALIVQIFQRYQHSTDPEVVWRLQRITEILEEARRRRDEAIRAAN